MLIKHPGGNILKDFLSATTGKPAPKNMELYNQYGPAGQYQRYRQMSLDDLLLENRIVILIGEI